MLVIVAVAVHLHHVSLREKSPGRARVLGEYGGLGYAVEGHQWSSTAWGYGEKEVNRDPAAGNQNPQPKEKRILSQCQGHFG